MEIIEDVARTSIRPNENVSYVAFIGAGGYGEIHSVFPRQTVPIYHALT